MPTPKKEKNKKTNGRDMIEGFRRRRASSALEKPSWTNSNLGIRAERVSKWDFKK